MGRGPSMVGSVRAGFTLPRGVTAGSGTKIYLRPLADSVIDPNLDQRRLAGSSVLFSRVHLLVRTPDRLYEAFFDVDELEDWADQESVTLELTERLRLLTTLRPPFAGFPLQQPRIMGIVNVTPDSFSDGGQFTDPDTAIAHGKALIAAGADLLDIGGESTRPGAQPVSAAQEETRVLPVVTALATSGLPVSIDTRHAATMHLALTAGAQVVNDVTALTGDRDSLSVVAGTQASVILMHMRGRPQTMQADPTYDHVVLDVYDYLAKQVARCRAAGIPRHRIAIDPGIGFGKTRFHNLQLLSHLTIFHDLGCAIVLGASRKRFIADVTGSDQPPQTRLPGSLAAAQAAVSQGVQMVRVHDVAATHQALAVHRAIAETR